MKNRKKRDKIEMRPMPVASNYDKAELGVNAVDSANMGAIFAMFFKENTTQFLEHVGKLGMFPLAAAGSIADAVFAIRLAHREVKQAKIENRNSNKAPIVNATIKTGAAIAVTTAVVLGFTALAALAPVIFAVTLAVKTLYHAGASLVYAGAAAFTKNPVKKENYRKQAVGHGVGAVASLLATAAVVGVMLLGHAAVAAAGVAAGVIGLGFTIYKIYKMVRAEIAKPLTLEKNEVTNPLLDSDSDEEKNVRENTLNTTIHKTILDSKGIQNSSNVQSINDKKIHVLPNKTANNNNFGKSSGNNTKDWFASFPSNSKAIPTKKVTVKQEVQYSKSM